MDEREPLSGKEHDGQTRSFAETDPGLGPALRTNGSTRSLAGTGAEQRVLDRVEADVLVGQMIGDYQVRRLLGSGGMGRVYLARDVKLGRSVALKIVRGSQHTDFLDEARAIARLNHPNIVQI